MSKQKGVKKMEKKTAGSVEWLQLLPILFIVTVFLFCVRGRIAPSYLTEFFWFTKGEYVGDLYTYFRAQTLFAATGIGMVYLLFSIFTGKIKLEKHKVYIPMAVYALMVVVSYALSEYKDIALMGYETRYEGTIVLLCYMLMLFYAIHAVRSEKNVRLIVKCFAVACCILGFWGIAQVFGFSLGSIPQALYMPAEILKYGSLNEAVPDAAVNWFFGNQNYTSFFMVFPICIFGMSCIGEEDMKKKVLYAALTGLMMYNLWQSASLGGMVGIAVSVVVAVLLAGGKNIAKWRKSLGMLALAGVISVAASMPVIMKEMNDGAAAKAIFGLEVAYAEEDDAPLRFVKIEDIITEGSQVTFLFEEKQITIAVENDAIKSITDQTGAAVADDNDFLRAHTELHEETGYQLLKVDTANRTWSFAIVEGALYFVTPSGRLIELDVVERMGFEGKEEFATYRGYIWSRTLPLLKDTLLFGKGADTFVIHYPQDDYAGRYNIGYYTNQRNTMIDKPHNLYLGAAVNTGMVSMVALVVVYLIYLIESVKTYRKHEFNGYMDHIGMGICIAVAGFMVSALVNDSTVHVMPVVYVLMGTGFAINRMVKARKKTEE